MQSFEYFETIRALIDVVKHEESEAMSRASLLLTKTIIAEKNIYIFGASHAGILAQEAYYRAGGLALINPIFARELSADVSPITQSSKMESLHGYGTILAESVGFESGDCLLLHSVSGRNPVVIDLALFAKERGVQLIGITNVKYSKQVKSRHQSGLRLFEICDIVLDNHGPLGDACVSIKNTEQKVGPTSTVIGAMMLNQVICETVKQLSDQKIEPLPVFYSANVDGGKEKNEQMMSHYRQRIKYRY